MDISAAIDQLTQTLKRQAEHIKTEEATKTALIMPFINQVLGYNVFNPQEVVPEFTADHGTKQGEKVDYAILHNSHPEILIEAKALGSTLNINHASQLFRYFGTQKARVGILTNGREWQFYSDLEAPNRMDSQPFMVLDLAVPDRRIYPQISKLAKNSFDVDSVVSAAEELRNIAELKKALGALFDNPDDDWIKHLGARIHKGKFTQKQLDRITPLVKEATHQFLSDRVNDRLAQAQRLNTPNEELEEVEPGEEENIITPEEIEAYQIVKAIACAEAAPHRIGHRDTKSYLGILLDDNNRKPIARLRFTENKMVLGIIGPDNEETKRQIKSIDSIYNYAREIRAAVKRNL